MLWLFKKFHIEFKTMQIIDEWRATQLVEQLKKHLNDKDSINLSTKSNDIAWEHTAEVHCLHLHCIRSTETWKFTWAFNFFSLFNACIQPALDYSCNYLHCSLISYSFPIESAHMCATEDDLITKVVVKIFIRKSLCGECEWR